MALLTHAVAITDESSNAGWIFDSATGTVLYIGILKPLDSRSVRITVTRSSDGVTFTAPNANGDMIVNIQTSGLMVDPSDGAEQNFSYTSGTL